MKLNKIEEKDIEKFNDVTVHPLQSWEWGEFRKEWGNEVVRLGVFENETQTDSIQIVFSKIPKTKYKIGTVLRGPKPTKEILDKLKEVARKNNAILIKLEPSAIIDLYPVNPSEEFNKKETKKKINEKYKAENTEVKLLKKHTVAGRTLFTPESFWVDLSQDEDTLLKSMHSKTRYNVRYAERKNVAIVEDNSDKAFRRYIELMRETVERQGFYAHTERYHRLMWEHLHNKPISEKKEPIARLLTAKHKDKILTTWIVFVWGDFLYYPYGASSNENRNLQHSSAMMWGAIKYGKSLGLKWFDLWGREEGEGFTRFKEGFNPYVVKFIGTWDLAASNLYWPYRLAEEGRWLYLKTKAKSGVIKHKF